jgi:prepilin-type processing-associated H-X9-DG protein
MAILIPALNKAKEHGKRAACLSNLKQLTLAWQMYAQANDDKIVNGAPRVIGTCPTPCTQTDGTPGDCKATAEAPTNPPGPRQNEIPWVGNGWHPTQWGNGIPASECCQLCAMQTGAMWKYVQEKNIYHCPTGFKGELITYETIDSMNGLFEWRDTSGQNKNKPFWNKNLNQIKNATNRIVYMDTGRLTPDSFAVYWNSEQWFDLPMTRHGMGTNVSFADGHSARWMWKAKETVDCGEKRIIPCNPTTVAGKQDLYKVQIGCWGKLGYNPTAPLKLDD